MQQVGRRSIKAAPTELQFVEMGGHDDKLKGMSDKLQFVEMFGHADKLKFVGLRIATVEVGLSVL